MANGRQSCAMESPVPVALLIDIEAS